MNEINKVVIVGAGAMGTYFSSRFFETAGFSVAVAAKGERFDRLKRDGLVINIIKKYEDSKGDIEEVKAKWRDPLILEKIQKTK